MELDLRSEVNTIYNSSHVTEVCLLIGWTDMTDETTLIRDWLI